MRFKTWLLACAIGAGLYGCGGSSGSGGSPLPPPPPPPAANVTISGTVSYEFPPPNNNCVGINLNNPLVRPIRQATIQLLDSNGTTVVATQVSSDNGGYAFAVDGSTDYILRVRAELIAANWNVEVRNNVDTSANPAPLAQRPIYVLDFPFNSGGADNPNLNLTAATGWGGSSYTGVRAAAPFAILDTIYSAIQFVLAEDPSANFPPLDAFWSPDNQAAFPVDIDIGDLSTTFYNGERSLFMLGRADGVGADPDEFDDHIVVHEWGHYFEDVFSRSDSIGGSHSLSQSLDMRTAFGEGWASALAGMVLNDPVYCDTRNATSGGGFSAETTTGGTDGWFNEFTILRIIYDLWDTNDDSADADTASIGFGPIYEVMTGPQSTTDAFTSIFSFATYLKQLNPGQNAFIDSLLTAGGINPVGIDIWGSTEVNDGPATPMDVLDVYTPLTLGAPPISICANSQFDTGRDGNKLSEHRYLRFNLAAEAQVSFTATANPAPSQPSNGFDCTADPNAAENSEHSDPDMLVYRNGVLVVLGFSCTPNSEVTPPAMLQAGEYVIDLNDFRHEDPDSPIGYPERVCFDVSAN